MWLGSAAYLWRLVCAGFGAAGGEGDQQCCRPAQSRRSPAQSPGVHLHRHPALRSEATPQKRLTVWWSSLWTTFSGILFLFCFTCSHRRTWLAGPLWEGANRCSTECYTSRQRGNNWLCTGQQNELSGSIFSTTTVKLCDGSYLVENNHKDTRRDPHPEYVSFS